MNILFTTDNLTNMMYIHTEIMDLLFREDGIGTSIK